MQRSVVAILLGLTASIVAQPGDARYPARDTFKSTDPQVGYTPVSFEVVVAADDPADEAESPNVVRFPSPRPDTKAGERVNTAVLEWYPARGVEGPAPAVLVLHTLDYRLFYARGTARALAGHGLHAFVLHAPGYGLRRYDRPRLYGEGFFERSAQTVADARRARDAIAVLPGIDPAHISIQGTSLGGFWATVAASLDGAFEHAFIFLAGADLHHVLTHGVREAAWLRQSLERSGIDDAKLRQLCIAHDPARHADRLDPSQTWLFSARSDQVVPRHSAEALAAAIGLDAEHHVWLSGDHYTAMLHLPWIAQRIAEVVHGPLARPKPVEDAASRPIDREAASGVNR